jgi:hypothetical protein
MLFTFAGSTHSKYVTYLLETICTLELESSPALREAILRSMLVTLSGKPGTFSALDLTQEYFNRLLEAIVERKGVEYGEPFIRNVISRNLHHFARIKLDLRDSVGLAKRSGRHSAPHMKPEVKKLLETYLELELHRRRAGRMYDNRDVDDFRRGMVKLQGGKVKKWAMHTTKTRDIMSHDLTPRPEDEDGIDELNDGELEEGVDEPNSAPVALGIMQLVDGELVVERVDADESDEWITEFEKEYIVSEREEDQTDLDDNNECDIY